MLDARDRAATGADLENVHHRNLNRQRLLVTADQSASGRQRLAVKNHPGFGGRPTHIESDRILKAECPTDRLGADHAGGRTRFENADAFVFGAVRTEQTTCRLHH